MVVFRPCATRQHVIEAGLEPGTDLHSGHSGKVHSTWLWLAVMVVEVEVRIALWACRRCNSFDAASEHLYAV